MHSCERGSGAGAGVAQPEQGAGLTCEWHICRAWLLLLCTPQEALGVCAPGSVHKGGQAATADWGQGYTRLFPVWGPWLGCAQGRWW